MVDGAPTPSAFAPGPPRKEKPGIFAELKVDFPALLAIAVWILFAIVMIASAIFHVQIDAELKQTLQAIVMIVTGFYWGSSAGSKRKDDATLPPHA